MNFSFLIIEALERNYFNSFVALYKGESQVEEKFFLLNRHKKTLVYYACVHGRFKILKFLLENNSDFESSPEYPLHSPLYTAFFRGYLDCAALILVEMLKNGKDISKLPKQLRTHSIVERYMSRMSYLILYEGFGGYQRHYLLDENMLHVICHFL